MSTKDYPNIKIAVRVESNCYSRSFYHFNFLTLDKKDYVAEGFGVVAPQNYFESNFFKLLNLIDNTVKKSQDENETLKNKNKELQNIDEKCKRLTKENEKL
ncbi:16992_t:CDS:1, partial [Racocetra fulgida]